MKIRAGRGRLDGVSSRKAMGSGNPLESTENRSFDDLLQESRYRTAEEQLTQILHEIDEQGKKLARKMTLSDLYQYKKLVSQFLDKAVEGMLQFSKQDFFDRRGRHNIYGLIKKVNEKLEDLTKEVLQTQNDNLVVLNHIDDIRGLLMDMLL